METIDFKLQNPIKFDKAGVPGNESYCLILQAPTYNERKFARKLKQRLTEAMMYVTRQGKLGDSAEVQIDESKKDEPMDGQSILFMLQSVPENVLDWSAFVDWFTESCASVIFVEEGVGLTISLIKQMDIDVVDEMVGTYLANFTWNSLMKPSGSQ